MKLYKIVFARHVDQMLLRHTEFLARVSAPAAMRFYQDFENVLTRIAENPFQFPLEEDLNLPSGQYRRAIFAKRYKAVFSVSAEVVYLDAVVDCRMNNKYLST